MGVAVREKQTGSGIYWLFIRHAGERVSQMVGDKETAEDAAKDIRKDIWRGKFDIAAMKAARAKEKRDEKPNIPTLKEYFDRFERESLALAVGESTQDVYSNAFNRHLIPTTIPESPELEDSPVKAFGEFRLSEISRAHIKVLINALLRKKCSRLVNVTAIDDGGNEITTKKAREFHCRSRLSGSHWQPFQLASTTPFEKTTSSRTILQLLSEGSSSERSHDMKASIHSSRLKYRYSSKPFDRRLLIFSRCSSYFSTPESAAASVPA